MTKHNDTDKRSPLKRFDELVPDRKDDGLISSTQYHRDEQMISEWLDRNPDGKDCVIWLLNHKWSQITPCGKGRDLWLWGQFDRLIEIVWQKRFTLNSDQFRVLIADFESLSQKDRQDRRSRLTSIKHQNPKPKHGRPQLPHRNRANRA